MSRVENQILEFIFQGKDAGLTGMSSKVEKSLDSLHKKADSLSNLGDKDQGIFGTLFGVQKANQTLSTSKMMSGALIGLVDKAIESYADFEVQMIGLRRATSSTREEQRGFTTDAITATSRYGVAQKSVLSIMAMISQGGHKSRLEMNALAGEMAHLTKTTGASEESLAAFQVLFDSDTWQPLVRGMNMSTTQFAHAVKLTAENTKRSYEGMMNSVRTEMEKVLTVTDPASMAGRVNVLLRLQEAAAAANESFESAGVAFSFTADPKQKAFGIILQHGENIEEGAKNILKLYRDINSESKRVAGREALEGMVGEGNAEAGLKALNVLVRSGEFRAQVDKTMDIAARSTIESRKKHERALMGVWEKFGDSFSEGANAIKSEVLSLGGLVTTMLTPSLDGVTSWFDKWAAIIRSDYPTKILQAWKYNKDLTYSTLGRYARLIFGDIDAGTAQAEQKELPRDQLQIAGYAEAKGNMSNLIQQFGPGGKRELGDRDSLGKQGWADKWKYNTLANQKGRNSLDFNQDPDLLPLNVERFKRASEEATMLEFLYRDAKMSGNKEMMAQALREFKAVVNIMTDIEADNKRERQERSADPSKALREAKQLGTMVVTVVDAVGHALRQIGS
jgi:hypothetical protein